MIRAYFNLKDIPFKKDANSEQLFKKSAQFDEGFKRLEYIREQRGMMLLSGDPGVGKTNLLRHFVASVNQSHYKIFYLPLSTVNILDFYRQLNIALTGECLHRKSALFNSIQSSIIQYVKNRKVVPIIIFDEAHFLKNETFGELQIISNFDMDSTNPLVIIIAGQPHLRDRLNRDIHAAFNQRITLRYHMEPLSKEDSCAYLDHSMKIAGCDGAIFTDSAKEAIFRNTQGNMRLIGNIATRALEAAVLTKKNAITEEEVFLAAKEQGY